MKVVIVGSGGVGGYYGSMLARAGHDTFFIARGRHLEKIRESGLHVKSCDGDFSVRAEAGPDSSGFGEADLVVICVKSYDTFATLDLYSPSVGPNTSILSLQNGIDNELILAERFGREKILGGVAFIGSRVEAPGVILHTAFGHITIGGLEGDASPRAERMAQAFNEAGVKCRLSDDITLELWRKMVWNVGFNALCAILDTSAKNAAAFEDTGNTVHAAMTEWIDVAQASGVPLDHSLAARNIEVTLKGGEVIPSLLHDKRRGRKMEIDTFNGKVSELGKKMGVPTPVNDMLAAIVRFYNSRL